MIVRNLKGPAGLISSICICASLFGHLQAAEVPKTPKTSPQKSPNPSAIEQIRQLVGGFSIGKHIRVLPYVSMDDWFDPYAGLKLGHALPWAKKDRAYHHFKVESPSEFSWKFRYAAESLCSGKTGLSLLYKVKFDRDAYFYDIGNETQKKDRQPATYRSHFAGIEISQIFLDKIVARLSPGFWDFESGLLEGGEFEQTPHGQYFSTRLTVSDRHSINYWGESIENQWSAYVEWGAPIRKDIGTYVRMQTSTVSRFPLSKNTRLSVGSRFEYLLSADFDRVPYFALPEVGSRSGLRGYSKARFRDRAVASFNLEYSLLFAKQFSLVGLADLAKTSSDLNLLPLKNFHINYGLALRFMNENNPITAGITNGVEGIKLFSTIATGLPW